MRLKNPENYKLLRFEIGRNGKKYEAVLQNKEDGKIARVPFGDSSMQQYHDKIGHYSHLDHFDEKRRAAYLRRHRNDKDYKFSSGFFSATQLW